MDGPVDLRSDTVTRPTAGMLAAMHSAQVGDDVYGDDPSVNALEREAARLSGKEAALFVTSGTQSNLCAILSHCARGDEYLAGTLAHTYHYEAGGAAVLGSVQPQPIPFQADGTLALADLEAHIKPDDPHFARTRLICLENTQGGKPLPLTYGAAVAELARHHGLLVHLDGARLFNAAVAQGQSLAALAADADSVSVCLSKGLGAPAGSVLCGSSKLIAEARRWRKMLGGAMRQAGYLAAAGSYALRHHVDRLADDHVRATRVAEALNDWCAGAAVAHTNMVFVGDTLAPATFHALTERLAAAGYRAPGRRWVFHLDVSEDAVDALCVLLRRLPPPIKLSA